MSPSEGIWVAWSGGKDSALVLLRLRQQGYPIAGLVTTVVGSPPLVPFHSLPLATVEQQARALGLPLVVVRFRRFPSDALYARRFRAVLRSLQCRCLAFGDIFLEDVRRYREKMLARLPLQLLFPLWEEPTAELAQEVLQKGIQALLTCVDQRHLSPHWLGKPYDATFLASLPPTVDPCGERGEFHTCVLHMPGFRFALAPAQTSPFCWAQHWQSIVLHTREVPSS